MFSVRNKPLLLAISLLTFVACQEIKIVVLKQHGQEDVVKVLEETLNYTLNDLRVTVSHAAMEGNDEDYQTVCQSISGGVALILDLTWTGNDPAFHLSNNMSIPYIQSDVSIGPFLELLDAYLDARKATDVLVIFDHDRYIDQALYYWLDSTRLRMIISNLDKKAIQRINKIRPTPNSFAIIAATSNVSSIFNQALKQDLLKLPERWNLVFTDFRYKNFDRDVIGDLPITVVTPDEDFCCDMLLRDECQCPSDFNMQSQFIYWLSELVSRVVKTMLDDNLQFPKVLKCNSSRFPEQTKQRFDEIVENLINESSTVIKRKGNSLTMNVKGIFEKNVNGTLEMLATYRNGEFNTVKGGALNPIKAFYRIGITHALPWSYKEQDPQTGESYWTGYCVDFANKLSEVMGFDFEFVEPKSGTFGEKVNGSWDGVVGDLARGDTDIAITAIIMTADREEVIDFVAPYFEQTGITIVMRKPVRKTSLFKFMTVLKLEVWLSIVAALIVTGFMIWFLDKYSPYSARNNKKAYPYPCREFTLKESFWFALTSFTPQGGGEAPKALSGRTLVAAYWLFVVLMLATFTANLAAFLTVERMQAPVQSLEQLARQSRINYTVVKNSETHKYFINMKYAEDTLYRMWKELTLNASTDDTRYRVWDYPIREQYGHILLAINDSNPVPVASEGFRLVDEHLDADFAFIHDSSEIKYEISRNCNFTEVGEVFAEKPYAVAIQQGSHLQDDLSKVILDLQKDRFFENLQSKYWNHSSKGNCPSTDDNEGITLESLGGVFIATLFGLALAMITLAGEVLYYKRKGQREESKKKLQVAKVPKFDGLILPPKYTVAANKVSKMGPAGAKHADIEGIKIAHISLYPKARNRITQVS
ncbi:ionotropic receptor 25a [Cylas formicarius]|uniref:ionotropic receptor 25a n=1 Tax=Cylas formicarius TaxID=197179 RepID=UPI00295859C8|nr:ionotropic receptor 25a [Cylas formicarius]